MLLGAGILTGVGQIILRRLSSANGIDTTAAIWFYAGRMPALRTLGSAVLSVIIVAMGVSLGREGAPKQAGAVIANFFSRPAACPTNSAACWWRAARAPGWRQLMACRLGGALFALEVMRGMLALRYVLPALVRISGCHRSLMAGASRCADLSDPGLCQLRFERCLGACRRTDRGRGFGWLRSGSHLGRSP